MYSDLKPENLLIGSDNLVKIADFGLAVYHGTPRPLTAEVVTIWYRCPELFFGARHYSFGVDVWSIGCIFAEIMLKTPLFQGRNDSEIEQLGKIFNLLGNYMPCFSIRFIPPHTLLPGEGTPRAESWKDANLLPNYVEFEHRDPLDLSDLLKFQQPEAKDLLLEMLVLNPLDRISASAALSHAYFKTGPPPTFPADLPKTGAAAAVVEDIGIENIPLKRMKG